MSFSRNQQESVYIPVTASALPLLYQSFPSGAKLGLIDDVFYALTDHGYVETLQMVTVMQMIENHLNGDGRMFYLSALRKDRTGKTQTKEMKLLHDVMVEMPMNSYGYYQLQGALLRYNMQLVMMHSCGGEIIPAGQMSHLTWYNRVKDEQQARTWLDWSTTTKSDATNQDILDFTWMTEIDFLNIDKIFKLSLQIADLMRSEADTRLVA